MLRRLHALAAAVALAAGDAPPSYVQHQGWIGTYHTTSADPIADGAATPTSAWRAGRWGVVVPENSPSDGGFAFKDDIDFLCKGGAGGPGPDGVNAVYGMLIASSEGGVFSNPNDTDTFNPLPLNHRDKSGRMNTSSAGPTGAGGLLQGAARWSTLARTYCPQIAGVVIDDFWSNYDGDGPPPPPPPPPGECSKCPASQPHMYGDNQAGYYCCTWPAGGGHCSPPQGVPPHASCCLLPGSTRGCQHEARCGTNPMNRSVCGGGEGTIKLAFSQLADIRAALAGRTVLPDGTVDHGSPELTPWLKLFVVTYNEDIGRLSNQSLITNGIVGGLSFWIAGPSQVADRDKLGLFVQQVRAAVPPEFPVFTGGYITYSSIGWMEPGVLNSSVDLYDAGVTQGFYVFAGDVIAGGSMNETIWKEFDLGNSINRITGPHLGTVAVTVVDAATGAPVGGAVGTVTYGASTHVTRKATSADAGAFTFGGWSGRAKPVDHTVVVAKDGYTNATATVRVVPGETTPLKIELHKEGALE